MYSKILYLFIILHLYSARSELLCNIDITFLTCSSFDDEINSLTKGIVSDNSEVQAIYLSNSKLSSVASDSFDGLPSLEVLDLSQNEIETLLLTTFESLNSVQVINMSYNNIIELPIGLFDNMISLTTLDISNNQLKNITALANLPFLNTLDVSKNLVEDIPLLNLPELNSMDISNNRITNYGLGVGMNIPKKLSRFRLHNNPWQCGCLDQLLMILKRRKIQYAVKSYFNGEKPICVVLGDKVNRCIRDSSKNQQIYKIFKRRSNNIP